MLKWAIDNEPVWLAMVVTSVTQFLLNLGVRLAGFDPGIVGDVMTMLPLLLAPLTRRATTSNVKVSQAVEVAASTGSANAGRAVAEVKQ